jgi:hypothetical protein
VNIFDLMRADAPSSASRQVAVAHPKFPAFVPPAIPSKYSKGDSIRAMFGNLQGFRPQNAINTRSLSDIERPPGAKDTVENYELSTFPSSKYDGLEWAALHQIDLPVAELQRITQVVTGRYFGKGSLAGLITRMASQLLPASRRAQPVSDAEWTSIQLMSPTSNRAQLSEEDDLKSVAPAVNPLAQAGPPYFRPGVKMNSRPPAFPVNVAEQAVRTAETMLRLFDEHGPAALDEWLKPSSPHYKHMVMVLSAKSDIYERSEFFTKTRPFGFTGSALRLVFACVVNTAKQNALTFLEHPDSISALRFSWVNGGTNDLVRWLATKDNPGMRNIAWGDDQILKVTCANGDAFLLAPDVSGMDMKIHGPTFDLYGALTLGAFGGVGPNSPRALLDAFSLGTFMTQADVGIGFKWLSVLQFYIEYCKSHPVLTAKHYVFQQTVGALSGITGITMADEAASKRLIYAMRQVPIPPSATPNNLKVFSKRLLAAAEKAGFPLKPSSMDVQITRVAGEFKRAFIPHGGEMRALDQSVEIGLPFLGMRIYAVEVPEEFVKPNADGNKDQIVLYVPGMDHAEVASHLVLKRPSGETEREVAAKKMQGLLSLGLYATANPYIFANLVRSYNQRRAMGFSPLIGVSVENPCMPEDVLVPVEASDQYPPHQWYLQLYASEEQKARMNLVSDIPQLTLDDEVADSIAVRDPQEEEEEKAPSAAPPRMLRGGVMAPVAAAPAPVGPPRMVRPAKKDVTPTAAAAAPAVKAAHLLRPPMKVARKDVPVTELISASTRQLLEDSKGSNPSRAHATASRPTPSVKATHPVTAPPMPEMRAANEERHRVKADAQYQAAMASRSAASHAPAAKAASKPGKARPPSPPPDEEAGDDYEDEAAEADNREVATQRALDAEVSEQALEEAQLRRENRLEAGDDGAVEEEEYEDTEADVHYDPTMSAAKQGANWSRGAGT